MAERRSLYEAANIIGKALGEEEFDVLTKRTLTGFMKLINQIGNQGSLWSGDLQELYDTLKLTMESEEYEERGWSRLKYDKATFDEIKHASIKICKSYDAEWRWIPEWVAQAVQLYQEQGGYADMKLRNFIRKMKPQEESNVKSSPESDYRKRYPKPRNKGEARRQRRGDDGYNSMWQRNRDRIP